MNPSKGDLPTMHDKPGDGRDLALLRSLKARGIPTVPSSRRGSREPRAVEWQTC
jgi:hypothetical protein